MSNNEYAGFWIRVAASIIDSILLMLLLLPIAMVFGLGDSMLSGGIVAGVLGILLNYVLPGIAVILFWHYKSATPGKLMLNLRILDAETGGKASTKQCIGRYLAYYVSAIVIFLGFIWVGIDERKQGWHDKLASTVVVRNTGA